MPHPTVHGWCKMARRLAAAALLATLGALPLQALATIFCCNANTNIPDTGANVELVFVAWDRDVASGPKVSFVKDLGITMGDFLAAQVATGDHRYFWLSGTDDPAWQSFLDAKPDGTNKLDMSKAQWAVLAYDSTGGITPGELNLYTTVQQGVSGDPAIVLGLSEMTGGSLQGAQSSYNDWLSAVNLRGTHATQANGSALISVANGIAFAFGDGQPGTIQGEFNYNNNLQRTIGNLVGKSSWFYRMTSSDADSSFATVTLNEFENTTHDGYWGFAAGTDPARPGQYLLSYTLDAVTSATEQSRGVLFGNTFAQLTGTLSLASPVGKAGSLVGMTEAFLRGLAEKSVADTTAHASAVSLNTVTSAVPEPAAAALALAGVAAVLARTRRRRAA